MAVAQKFPPAAAPPTAGQSPFGCWHLINGARSSGVTLDPDGDE
jgi:hypothetical protein